MGPRVRINSEPDDKTDASFTAGIDYTLSKYSLQPQFDIHYFTQHYEVEFNRQLPKIKEEAFAPSKRKDVANRNIRSEGFSR